MINAQVSDSELGNIQSSLDYFAKFNIPKDARILDVGCNHGSLIFNLSKLGYGNVEGVDVNGDAIEKGKQTYPEISEKISRQEPGILCAQDQQYDVVLMFDVIEHVPDINRFLNDEVFRVLKKGGTFIFQTPNKFINIPWEIINQRSLTAWKSYHCSLQTYGSLKSILENAHFQSICIEKNNILSDHNKSKVKRKLGIIGIALLHVLQVLPIVMYPNFWGYCYRKG